MYFFFAITWSIRILAYLIYIDVSEYEYTRFIFFFFSVVFWAEGERPPLNYTIFHPEFFTMAS